MCNENSQEQNKKLNRCQRDDINFLKFESNEVFDRINVLAQTYDSEESLAYFMRAKDTLEIAVMLAEKGVTA